MTDQALCLLLSATPGRCHPAEYLPQRSVDSTDVAQTLLHSHNMHYFHRMSPSFLHVIVLLCAYAKATWARLYKCNMLVSMLHAY